MSTPRGRYAPTPSGWLHLGNARTALAAWLSIRAQGGAFVWRLEDLDGPRTVAGMAQAAEEDLRWLGLDWDEGPQPVGGPFAPYVQSQRAELYEEALERLAQAGRLFPCRVSRADLANLATAPHGREGTPPYPAPLRPKDLAPDWFEAMRADPRSDAALRFRVDSEPVSFVDRLCGPVTERVDETVGDFVLKRRDGVYAYQLAVVVDDLGMGITEVVRGRDLLDSTARQIQLIQALGGSVPEYAHLPLVVNAEGEKLSKRDDASRVRALRGQGIAPEVVVGRLGASLGLLDRPEPCRAEELIPLFEWGKVPRGLDPLRVDVEAR